jgi:predicted O-methyltransferase YrrM
LDIKSRLRKIIPPGVKRIIRRFSLRQMSDSYVVSHLDQIARAISANVPDNGAYPIFSKYGFHLLRKHYYLPIPDDEDLSFVRDTALIGVAMNEEIAFDLLENVLNRYKAEFNGFPINQDAAKHNTEFYLINGSFMAIDGNVYYALIRDHKPKRVIEIGSGNSTLLAAAAIQKNSQEHPGEHTDLICIEPYPRPMLRGDIPEITDLITQKVQTVDLSLFESLRENDILFIDSTHALRPGGDVWWEYCEILPRLAPGVLIHIHDISLPKPYPNVYLDYHWYWTEQYVLQIFLSFNSRFEVIWPGNYLMTKYPDRMRDAFSPEYGYMREKFPSSEPSSLWMRVRPDAVP